MLIPEAEKGNILSFVQKYFVADEMGAESLTDEGVRVMYYEGDGSSFGDGVSKKFLHFDVYVKREVLHTSTNDRLQRRDKLIAYRLQQLLTSQKYICQMSYRYEDAFDLGAKTIGYKRYHIVFSYRISY